jgi:hypothetical protein
LRILLHQGKALLVGPLGLLMAAHRLVGAGQHHPALQVLRLLLQLGRQAGQLVELRPAAHHHHDPAMEQRRGANQVLQAHPVPVAHEHPLTDHDGRVGADADPFGQARTASGGELRPRGTVHHHGRPGDAVVGGLEVGQDVVDGDDRICFMTNNPLKKRLPGPTVDDPRNRHPGKRIIMPHL